MGKKIIYLDHAATTPVLTEVLEKMEPYFIEKFGNPSSIHSTGRKVKIPIEEARNHVANALGTSSARVIFTSGGTESDFLAITGAALANQEKGKHIIISNIEHSAVNQAASFLTSFGFEVTYLPVNQAGLIDMDKLISEIRADTILISMMYVNNEIGVKQPVEEIGHLAREKGVLFHTDAVQAFPILDIQADQAPIDLLTISSHKINGPKGVGALYLKKDIKFQPIIGGTQEKSKRGGTENVPGIIGFGEAARLLKEVREEKYSKFKSYKQKMIEIWKREIGEEYFITNGDQENAVPSILNVSFLGIDSHTMIMTLDMKNIAVSGGSACASSTKSISRVINALNPPEEVGKSAIRISFGSTNTEEEIKEAAFAIAKIVKERLGNRK